MDMHLQFIVDQTQKYSNWLVQGMTGSTPSATPSLAPSLTPTSLLSENGEESNSVCSGTHHIEGDYCSPLCIHFRPKFQSVT